MAGPAALLRLPVGLGPGTVLLVLVPRRVRCAYLYLLQHKRPLC